MQGYQNYSNLLGNAIASHNAKVQEQSNKFATKLSENESLQKLIEVPTDTVGGLILGKPISIAGKEIVGKLKGIAKKKGKELAEKAISKIKEKVGGEEEGGEEGIESTEAESEGLENTVTFNNPVYDPESFPESNAEWLQRSANETTPAEGELAEGANAASAQASTVSSGSATDAGASASASLEDAGVSAGEQAISTGASAVEGAVANAGASVGEAIGGGAGASIGEAIGGGAGGLAAEAGADAGLAFLGPLGWIIMAGLGIGTIVGGVEGAMSHKNPTIPKPPPMANVSTQFGVGS